ncbi:MAG: HD-GYP domain-containing protein [bacterium]
MGKRISIRKVEPGDSLKAVFNKQGQVLDNDVRVDDKRDINELKHQGASYVLYPEPSTQTSEDGKSSEKDERQESSPTIGDLEDLSGSQLNRSDQLYQKTLNELEDVFEDVHGSNISEDQLLLFENHLENFIQLVNSDPVSLGVLTMLEDYNDSTYNHSINVSIFSILYGKFHGFSDAKLLQLAFAALMHDMGKVKIPEDILEKPGELDDSEFEVVKDHPIKGWKILDEALSDPTAPQVALEHHERPDGSGYPFGVDTLSSFSRIVSVVDVYEALTAPRAYKKARDPMHAYRTLRDEFEEHESTRTICDELIQALGILPVGTLVRLSNGQYAIVAKNNPSDFMRPKIIVMTDETGASLDDNYYRVDLQHSRHQKYLVNNQIYDDAVEIESVASWENWSHLKKYAMNILDESRF